ncbi:MAG: hypothetical protein VYD05_15760, partial [Planctomycetota bacterium]|nr:hypothetical protein [Planctomycetota bacterium]
LRASFFRHIARVGKFVGSAPCEAFLLPCVERCLSDSSDEVVAWALKCLAPTLKLYKEAEEHLRKALALDPDRLSRLSGMALQAASNGQSTPQREQGLLLAKLTVRATGQREPMALATLGRIYAGRGQRQEARQAFSTALRAPKLRANPQLRAQIERALASIPNR